MSIDLNDIEGIKRLREEVGGDVTIDQALTLLNVSHSDFQKEIEKLPNMQQGNEETAVWLQAIGKAMEHIHNSDIYRGRLASPDAKWTNRPTYEERPIVAGRLKHGDSGGIISGEAAVMKVKARLGLGSIVPVPLWHTGGWITIKAPSNAAIFELNRRIAQEKVTLGRITNGMVFSNTGIYIQSYLINFILAHIYDTTLGTKNPDELKKIIKITDLPDLVWGMVCAMYPDGYELREPCVAQITKCNHVSSGRVNIARLRVVDTARLEESQLKHMSRRNGSRTEDELVKYQEAFQFGSKTCDVDGAEGISISLEVPSLAEFEQVGFNWVDSTVNMVDQAFRVPLKGNERDHYITEQGRLASLRQYSHWVKQIVIGNDDGEPDVIEDRDSIDATFADFSADETIRTSILNSIGEFIEECTISIVGYPNTECPSCGLRYGDTVKEGKDGAEDEVVRGENVPDFIPLDLTTTFFTLCEQRIQPTVSNPL